MSNRTALPRPLPRLLSPRLPVGRRWLPFYRSARTSLATVSAVVSIHVGLDAASAAYVSFGGTL